MRIARLAVAVVGVALMMGATSDFADASSGRCGLRGVTLAQNARWSIVYYPDKVHRCNRATRTVRFVDYNGVGFVSFKYTLRDDLLVYIRTRCDGRYDGRCDLRVVARRLLLGTATVSPVLDGDVVSLKAGPVRSWAAITKHAGETPNSLYVRDCWGLRVADRGTLSALRISDEKVSWVSAGQTRTLALRGCR